MAQDNKFIELVCQSRVECLDREQFYDLEQTWPNKFFDITLTFFPESCNVNSDVFVFCFFSVVRCGFPVHVSKLVSVSGSSVPVSLFIIFSRLQKHSRSTFDMFSSHLHSPRFVGQFNNKSKYFEALFTGSKIGSSGPLFGTQRSRFFDCCSNVAIRNVANCFDFEFISWSRDDGYLRFSFPNCWR